MSLNERYKAAVGVYSRIGACLQYTYAFIDHLVIEGLLELDRSTFTRQVVADGEGSVGEEFLCIRSRSGCWPGRGDARLGCRADQRQELACGIGRLGPQEVRRRRERIDYVAISAIRLQPDRHDCDC